MKEDIVGRQQITPAREVLGLNRSRAGVEIVGERNHRQQNEDEQSKRDDLNADGVAWRFPVTRALAGKPKTYEAKRKREPRHIE